MNNINKPEVGNRIKFLRKNLKVSQKELGNLIDERASQGIVQNWEAGNNLPSFDRLIKIAYLGNVTVPWLLFGDDENNLQNRLFPKSSKKLDNIAMDDYEFAYMEKARFAIDRDLETVISFLIKGLSDIVEQADRETVISLLLEILTNIPIDAEKEDIPRAFDETIPELLLKVRKIAENTKE